MFDAEQPRAEGPDRLPGESRREQLESAWASWKRESALGANRTRGAGSPAARDHKALDRIAVRLDSLERKLGRIDEELQSWRNRSRATRCLAVAALLVALVLGAPPLARRFAPLLLPRLAMILSRSFAEEPTSPRATSVPRPLP